MFCLFGMTQIRHSDTAGMSSVTKPSRGVGAKLPRGLHFVLCAGQLMQFPTVLVCIFIVVECHSSSWRSHGQVAYMAQQTTRARTNPLAFHSQTAKYFPPCQIFLDDCVSGQRAKSCLRCISMVFTSWGHRRKIAEFYCFSLWGPPVSP